jgi:hypothetical protein
MTHVWILALAISYTAIQATSTFGVMVFDCVHNTHISFIVGLKMCLSGWVVSYSGASCSLFWCF